MPAERKESSCGLVVNLDRGPEVIVAGGNDKDFSRDPQYYDDVFIYTVDTDSWREGKAHKHSAKMMSISTIQLVQQTPSLELSTLPRRSSTTIASSLSADTTGTDHVNAALQQYISMMPRRIHSRRCLTN